MCERAELLNRLKWRKRRWTLVKEINILIQRERKKRKRRENKERWKASVLYKIEKERWKMGVFKRAKEKEEVREKDENCVWVSERERERKGEVNSEGVCVSEVEGKRDEMWVCGVSER